MADASREAWDHSATRDEFQWELDKRLGSRGVYLVEPLLLKDFVMDYSIQSSGFRVHSTIE